LLRHRWDDLRSAAAVTDDGDTLVFVAHAVVPAGCVEHVALEILHSLELDVAGERNGANGGDEYGCYSHVFDASLQVLEFDVPLRVLVVPYCTGTLDGPVDVLADIELVYGVFHIYCSNMFSHGFLRLTFMPFSSMLTLEDLGLLA